MRHRDEAGTRIRRTIIIIIDFPRVLCFTADRTDPAARDKFPRTVGLAGENSDRPDAMKLIPALITNNINNKY